MIVYPFKKGGKINTKFVDFISDNFPSYEPFRERFLYPLTGMPADPSWRHDTFPDLEGIGMSTYGILKSLKFILLNIDKVGVGDPQQTFKNIYFHFGLIIDTVETLCRSVSMCLDYLEIIDIEKRLKISQESLISDFTTWVMKKYPVRFQEMIDYGKPIMYYPQHDNNYLAMLTTKRERNQYLHFTEEIKQFRNFYNHNPGVDIFINIQSQKRFVAKKDIILKARSWADLIILFERDKSLFMDPKEMIQNDLTSIANHIENLWGPITQKLDEIYGHKDFSGMMHGYVRDRKY
jgi:hypothetical protein